VALRGRRSPAPVKFSQKTLRGSSALWARRPATRRKQRRPSRGCLCFAGIYPRTESHELWPVGAPLLEPARRTLLISDAMILFVPCRSLLLIHRLLAEPPRVLPPPGRGAGFFACENQLSHTRLVRNTLALINAASVTYRCEKRSFGFNEHKKYPVAPGNAERIREGMIGQFLNVQPGIAPVSPEACFLRSIEPLDFSRKFLELLPELLGVEDSHSRALKWPLCQSRSARRNDDFNAFGLR